MKWPIWIHTLQVAFGKKTAFVAVRSVCALRLLSHAAAAHWKSLAKMELLLSPAGLSVIPRSSSDSHCATFGRQLSVSETEEGFFLFRHLWRILLCPWQ
ncbi:unnamed protein product [Sphagnum troendelagicum]|uniref:Secreted protein n=1 Tax=Sphagnum troendelagicum TaxID=128251 RepID=A0ABP0U8X8_9BRYO